ncbi:MAG: response regulator transcription factor [candidate division KSB1 bacterium]|nr:response regulator transcription factor [candidate division KSB1 bacterium]MDZ7301183.1 response regulator transcription factor [candidate division KSB1 bacterium]MDZ7310593.1 response regulator transcription factor [candidate division KSB1 bacterium]
MEKILIIEDEERILMGLEDDLGLEGYEVATAKDGLQGFAMAKEKAYDLIILDIMLPKMSGFEVCKQLRLAGIMTPILMLTAKSQEVDKVLGLELGADDYVTKPFSPRELQARVKALLRRAKPDHQESHVFRIGKIEIDFKKYEATKSGHPLHLTALEFNLLHLFIQHQNEVLSRDFILDKIWGEEVYVTNRTVDTHVAQLRKKIEDDPGDPKFILGVRGVGYMFAT